jgi:hypothetical protein
MAGQAFRDLEWEKRVQLICQESAIEHSLRENILRMMYVNGLTSCLLVQ